MEKVYKIVRPSLNGYQSYLETPHKLSYALDVATYPRIGKLFVFNSFEYLERFLYGNRDETGKFYPILECLTDQTENAYNMCAPPMVDDYLSDFWQGNISFDDVETPPVGTYFAPWVKPYKLIKEFFNQPIGYTYSVNYWLKEFGNIFRME